MYVVVYIIMLVPFDNVFIVLYVSTTMLVPFSVIIYVYHYGFIPFIVHLNSAGFLGVLWPG